MNNYSPIFFINLCIYFSIAFFIYILIRAFAILLEQEPFDIQLVHHLEPLSKNDSCIVPVEVLVEADSCHRYHYRVVEQVDGRLV